MSTVTIVLLVILVILIAALIGLYFFGKKAQKKQEEQQAQIEATKQTVSMLVIDKKRMPLKESAVPFRHRLPKRKVSLQNSRKTKLPDKCSQTYKLKVSESCHPYTQITDLFLFGSDRYLQRSRELTRSDQIVKFLQSFGCALIAR